MAESAGRRIFTRRKPRYAHGRDDDNLVRLRRHSRAEFLEARYADISETGMRFRVRKPVELREGDLIEVSVPMPGRAEPFAGRARVVRFDGDREYAARFDGLQDDVRRALSASLAEAFDRARLDSFLKPFHLVARFLRDRWLMLIGVVVAVALAFGAISWLLEPRGNYSPDKPIPWMSRTFF